MFPHSICILTFLKVIDTVLGRGSLQHHSNFNWLKFYESCINKKTYFIRYFLFPFTCISNISNFSDSQKSAFCLMVFSNFRNFYLIHRLQLQKFVEGQVIKSLNSFLFDLIGKYCFFKTEVCSHTMRASLVAQLVKNSPWFNSWAGKIRWRRAQLPTPGFFGFSGGKESTCNMGGTGFHPWIGKITWRRERLPTPVFLPGEFQGERNLVGCSLWGHKDSDTTERLSCSLSYTMRFIILCNSVSIHKAVQYPLLIPEHCQLIAL